MWSSLLLFIGLYMDTERLYVIAPSILILKPSHSILILCGCCLYFQAEAYPKFSWLGFLRIWRGFLSTGWFRNLMGQPRLILWMVCNYFGTWTLYHYYLLFFGQTDILTDDLMSNVTPSMLLCANNIICWYSLLLTPRDIRINDINVEISN